MGDGIRLVLTFASAAALTILITPLAIVVARRTGFLDRPVGFKAHRTPTPYLGGLAVLTGALLAIFCSATRPAATGRCSWARSGSGSWARSTTGSTSRPCCGSPSRRSPPSFSGARTSAGPSRTSDAANLALTVLWVVGVVNAFNLMDNLDGAAASVGAVSAACVGALAIVGDDVPLAVIGFALCGSLAGFLPYNLSRPSRIFLGDGGACRSGSSSPPR